MEKDPFFGSGGFLNLNWDGSGDHAAAQFESALSSLVSSPSSNPQPPAAADSVVIRELIGRLGSICSSGGGDISPTSHYQSTTTSCYSTPLNSPPKLNLMPGSGSVAFPAAAAAADPGFAERAARLSCFGARGYGQFGEPGKLSRASSSQSLKAAAAPAMMANGAQLEKAQEGEESSIASDRRSGANETSSAARKRKAAPKGKAKEAPLPPKAAAEEEEDSGAKRCKSGEADRKAEQDGNAKPAEPPKLDYIHVRARRGQATDSHSLAERVRRERISERMKFLQDLVPGCNKVTGKAVMLDEIINYVQSLQRQVEFLSMKLATVNPQLDINVDSLVPKDMHQPRGAMPPHSVVFPMEAAAAASAGFAYGCLQPQLPSLQSLMASGIQGHSSAGQSLQLPQLDGFVDASSQLGAFWEDDLQSVVQMGFGQNQEAVFSSQAFQGSMPTTNHMKIEL